MLTLTFQMEYATYEMYTHIENLKTELFQKKFKIEHRRDETRGVWMVNEMLARN